ncbi:right-handed parallel beta-helix repeat-containing protein [Geodermatophilus maliterrae]|uniref:Right-handed parallel beta-helix repeat-containing protein n=1 Tax=Geodermatophilus maliterrae TaxID=3162531 RepID=A0ABV3XJN5_9ACTN
MHHHTPTAGPRSRARTVRGLAVAGATGLLLAVLPSGVAAAGGHTLQVGPGEEYGSIQDAVDDAASGDTIEIAPGTYTEAVCIEAKGLTIIGSGRDETIIDWPLDEAPAVEAAACWTEQERVDPADQTPGDVSDNVSGLFFLDPDGPVSVTDLQTRDHPAHGIAAWGADGFDVRGTRGHGHGRYGILAADSTRSRIVDNVEVGVDRGTADQPARGTAAIAVSDSEDARARVAGNAVEGYNIGIFARESRGGRIVGNSVSGNCLGVVVFDDALTEIPDATRDVEGGDWTIAGNQSSGNDLLCRSTRGRGTAVLSGVGVQVTNADDVRIKDNAIQDNVPAVDPATLASPAGGLVLLSQPPFDNPLGIDPGPVEDIEVVGNTITGNVPADVVLGSPDLNPVLRPVGEGIEFEGNTCTASVPPEICAP